MPYKFYTLLKSVVHCVYLGKDVAVLKVVIIASTTTLDGRWKLQQYLVKVAGTCFSSIEPSAAPWSRATSGLKNIPVTVSNFAKYSQLHAGIKFSHQFQLWY
jgi:hypothetical protein